MRHLTMQLRIRLRTIDVDSKDYRLPPTLTTYLDPNAGSEVSSCQSRQRLLLIPVGNDVPGSLSMLHSGTVDCSSINTSRTENDHVNYICHRNYYMLLSTSHSQDRRHSTARLPLLIPRLKLSRAVFYVRSIQLHRSARQLGERFMLRGYGWVARGWGYLHCMRAGIS